MCGIAGYVSEKSISCEVLKKMTDRIAYRGPDAEGFYISPGNNNLPAGTQPGWNCGLGHRRLSIIDLEGGDQPIYNEDGSIAVVFNGEIYNYRELKEELEASGHVFSTKSDTEVLVHGFEQWGYDLVLKLRGMYAFAIWNDPESELFLARDKWGIKPLYYYRSEDSFLFASEIKAFLDHPDFTKILNENILAAYLCFNSTPTEETFFKGVYRAEPGHRLIFKDGSLSVEKFFELEFDETGFDEPLHDNKETDCLKSAETNDVVSEGNADLPASRKTENKMEFIAEEIAQAMAESVKYHQIADVEVGAFLSSGIDSSYLTSLARPDKSFTVGYSDESYDEIRYAKDLAEKLGISNISKEITKEEYISEFPNIIYHMDEPLADPAAIALYFVAKIASESVKVVTSGEGADELFGGYLTYREEIDQSGYMKIPFALRHTASSVAGLLPEFPGRNFVFRRGQRLEDNNIGLGRVFSDKEALSIVRNKDQIKTKDIVAPVYEKYKDNSNLVKRQAVDYYFWLVRDFLHAVDRNTMMFGLEARTPFLDDRVYEVARKLPVSAKISRETTKPALRMAASKVIPNDAYKKKKLGFPVPLREWMKEKDVHDAIKEKFNSAAAERFFETDKINKLLEDQASGAKDCYKKVWTIYTFLVWYEIYFNEETSHLIIS